MSLFPLFFSLPLINAKRSLSALERVSQPTETCIFNLTIFPTPNLEKKKSICMQSKTKIPRVPQTSIQKKHTRRSMQLHSNKLLCSGVLVVHCEYCEILREEISKAGHQGALFSHPTHLCRNNLLLLSRHGSSCINQLLPALPIPQPPLNTAREAGAYLSLFVFFGWVDW